MGYDQLYAPSHWTIVSEAGEKNAEVLFEFPLADVE